MKHHIYHHNDIDGHASGALIGLELEYQGVSPNDIKYYEIDYGKEFDDSNVDYDNDKVIMVDFALQPLERMQELMDKADLTWIDHHKTSVEWVSQQSLNDLHYEGHLRSGDKAACELIWDFYHENEACPKFIKMISVFDVWNKESEFHWTEEILPLHMYLETIETTPGKNIEWWKTLELREWCPAHIEKRIKDWIETGKVLQKFNDKRCHRLTKAYGYEGKFCGHKAFFLNSLESGSLQFEAAIDVNEYEVLVAYRKFKNEYWVVNLYSADPNMNCGALAKKLGNEGPYKIGGGHPGAAGFQTDTEHLLNLLKN